MEMSKGRQDRNMTLLNQSNPLFELEMKLDKADQLEFENRDFKTERKQGGKKCLHAMLIYLLLLTALSAYLTYKVFALQAEIHSYEYLLSKNSKLLSSTPTGVFPSVGQLQDTPQEFLSLLKNTSLEISTLRGDVSELQMRFTAVCEGPDGLSRQRKELDLLNKSIHSLQRNLDSLNHRANGNLLSLPTNTSLESNSLLGEMREMQDRFTALFEGHGGIQWLRENLNLLNVSTQYLKSRLDSLSLRAGLPGPRGPKGETGTAGARGPKGDQGSQGDQGRPGASGMKGEKGQKGEQEILDDQLLTLLRNTSLEGSSLRGNILDLELRFTDLCEGSGGLRWIKQELGLVNISTQFLKNQLDSLSQKPGLPGPRGPKGDQGVEGAHGPKGDQGAKGTEGRQGVPGIKGEKGEQGNQGSKGEQGFQGLRGLPGAKGEKGIRGITGLQGLKGEKGAKGEAVLGSNVRIAGGGSRGRVEVFVEGLWGTICDDEFDVTDGGVICRMLGYQKATSVFTGPSGTGKIWMDNLQCTGDEISIFNCKHRGLGVNDCSHSEDAAVVCV